MSWRVSRGRGQRRFKPEPFEITLPDPKSIPLESQLESELDNLDSSDFNSHYHLADGVVPKQENKSLDIERYSESLKLKIKSNEKGSFNDFLLFRPYNFPKELLGDMRFSDTPRERPVKRAKWSQEADFNYLVVFEKLEAKCKAEVKEEKQEGEDVDEEVEESQGEESDNGDYDQNQDFDDDDDNYNQADDGDQFEELY